MPPALIVPVTSTSPPVQQFCIKTSFWLLLASSSNTSLDCPLAMNGAAVAALKDADPETLRELGTEAAFLRLKARAPAACFHKLTALEGAVRGVCKTQLPPERKAELRRFFDGCSGKK